MAEPTSSLSLPSIDVHIHLAVSGCQCQGGWLHPTFKKRYTMKILQFLHGISDKCLETDFDDHWAKLISDQIAQSPIDYGVILGFDGVADTSGALDKNLSQLIIPCQWVFEVAKKFSNLLPAPSINPHRKDSLDLLDYCIEQKAVLIKWLPSAQLIDASSSHLTSFYKKLAQAQIPLLIHCGGEKTFKSLNPTLNHISYLHYPLKQGVKVICAHSATKVIGSREPDYRQELLNMLSTYKHLWVDNSGLCNPSRFLHVPTLAKESKITERMLYGSDWPVPANAFYFVKDMGFKKVLKIEREKNWIARDIAIKEFYGYPQSTYTNAHKVLANLSRWVSQN